MAEIEGRNGNEGFDVKARDVMVSNVITVGPDTPVREAAGTLVKHRISALPVVGKDGELVGIISEGDLMRRPELDTDYRRSWWLELFSDTDKSNETIASEYVKTHGRRVRDVMTREVITAKPGTSLREIADLLERNRIKRVPIVANGKLVGIVSRANLVQALASLRDAIEPSSQSDTAIREEVMAQLNLKPWGQYAILNATVEDGVVKLWGFIASEAQKEAVQVTVEGVRGVRGVENNLAVPTSVDEN